MASITFSQGSILPSLTQAILLVASIFSASLYFLRKVFLRTQKGSSYPIPDGPMGLPIVGSFPFLTKYPELTLDKWAKKFGSLYSFRLGNQLFMVLSDPETVKDLLIKNGSIFSSRKEMFLKVQTIFAGRGITATPYGDKWRKHRRLAVATLNSRAFEKFADVLDYEATVLMRDLYKYSEGGQLPINPQPFAGRCSLNNMLTVAFGIRTDTIDHPLVATALRLSREFMNCTGPISNLTDFVPLLQKIPNPMITRAKKLQADLLETYGGMIDGIDERMKAGEDVPDCLAKSILLSKEELELDDLDVSILCSAFMIGGVETTASIMQWFSALIPAYPEIQARAHEELDRVIGRDRLPTGADEKSLPYIRAIIKEVERVHNPFWLGTPHTNTEDFVYKGKFIPKNTAFIINTWTMHHDSRRFTHPDKFNPDHYFNDKHTSSESANLANPWERDHWMFGAGRRICPGMAVAEREIFLVIARLLWAFRMEEIPGEPIDLKEYDGASGRSPIPFRIRMVPRHESVAEVLGVQK